MKNRLSLIVSAWLLFIPALSFGFANTYTGIDNSIRDNSGIIPDSDGWLLVGNDPSYYTGTIMKVDSTGNCVWTRTYADYKLLGGAKADNGYMLYSIFYWDGTPSLMKVDASGNCVWTRSTADTNTEPLSMTRTADGGFIFSGYGFGANGENSAYVEKTDASGNCVWARSYSTYFYASKILNSGDGGYILTGSQNNTYWAGAMMKIDAGGNEDWFWNTETKTGYLYSCEFLDSFASGDGYVLAGYSYGGGVTYTTSVIVMKTDLDGNSVWEKTYFWNRGDTAYSVSGAKYGDGYGYLVAGVDVQEYRDDFYYDTYADIFIIQIDADGNCKNVISRKEGTYRIGLWNPEILYTGNGRYVLSADTYSDYFYDGYFFLADGSLKQAGTLPPPGGESSGKSIACPQPASDRINIVYALDSDSQVTIYIYNLANRLVAEVSSSEPAGSNKTTQIDIRKLPPGVYTYQITAKHNDGTTTRFKPDRFMVKR